MDPAVVANLEAILAAQVPGVNANFDAACDRARAAIAASRAVLKVELLEAFSDWLAREMPPGTVIGDPHWWAPRILRAVARAAPKAEPVADAQVASLRRVIERHATWANNAMPFLRRAADDGLTIEERMELAKFLAGCDERLVRSAAPPARDAVREAADVIAVSHLIFGACKDAPGDIGLRVMQLLADRKQQSVRKWKPIDSAPRGELVEVLTEDGHIDRAEWREARQCMVAPVAQAAGECGPGWVSQVAGWLPIDLPTHWRPLAAPPARDASEDARHIRVLHQILNGYGTEPPDNLVPLITQVIAMQTELECLKRVRDEEDAAMRADAERWRFMRRMYAAGKLTYFAESCPMDEAGIDAECDAARQERPAGQIKRVVTYPSALTDDEIRRLQAGEDVPGGTEVRP
jgi:hypothetical protein